MGRQYIICPKTWAVIIITWAIIIIIIIIIAKEL